LYEACSNAVIHGNKEDYRKKVLLSGVLEDSTLIISITDEGKGFNWRKEVDKDWSDSSAINGRGIRIFQAYGFEVEYNSRGNRLLLKKLLSK
jgi:anti-sigma regulatory factor (Ser/Thr protein kinase)